MNALEVITDSYERLNRLSPGETLDADAAAFGFRRLNLIVDQMSARRPFLFKAVQTSAVQTGNITLAAGSWAAIPAGTEIASIAVDNVEIAELDYDQFQRLYDTTTAGSPVCWAFNGLSTIVFHPVPNGQPIKILHFVGVSAFADQTTSYTVPQGYADALGASLACSLSAPILGRLPPELKAAERAAMGAIWGHRPKIIDVGTYSGPTGKYNIVNGMYGY